MSDIKCPVCGKQMKQATYDYDKKDNDDTLYMSIMPCDCVCNFAASKAVWQKLIRTRKALDVAKERLKNIILDAEILATPEYLASRAKEALAEITALEKSELENLEMLVNNVFK